MRSIEVTIDENGAIKVEAQGFRGKGCKAATEAIEKALGASSGGKFKPEYGMPQKEQAKLKH